MESDRELDLEELQDRFFSGKLSAAVREKLPDDLCELSELTEETLLNNLQRRFADGMIYTYVGSILVSVNPFRYLPIYNPKFGELYQGRQLGDSSLRPHVFAVADDAFNSMVRAKQRQCIVISGESGSGKTEATKLLLHHVMQGCAKVPTSEELRRILGTGPVLEAFGNAKTVSNNNSSRFGKFVMLNFQTNGCYAGASIEKYLLEKSRLIQQSQLERNYHIFYWLLAGADKKLKTRFFLLNSCDKYNILSGSEDPANKCYTVKGMDDVKEFESLQENMAVFFTPNQVLQVFQVIATLLNLGNIGFAEDESGEGSVVNTNDSLRVVSNLLRVNRETLGVALVTKKTTIRGQEFSCLFKVDEAEDNKRAMGKCLYEALFDWIVTRLNIKLGGRSRHMVKGEMLSIGILDIFGFENFPHNSFEQFCINFANEQLQQYFIRHIFHLEQAEYNREEITWNSIQYVDNQECLELLTKRPTGMFHLLDEESKLSQGNDTSLLEKCMQLHKSHSSFEVPHAIGVFIVKHYAGAVPYHINGFRDKNRDLMRQDIISVLQNSRTPFIRELIFKESSALRRWRKVFHVLCAMHYWKDIAAPIGEVVEDEEDTNHLGIMPRGAHFNRRKSWRKAKGQHDRTLKKLGDMSGARLPMIDRDGGEKRKATPKTATVCGHFMSSLGYLMETLSSAHPYFVRCIKSNQEQKPLAFDEDKIITQLRYCGMLETVRIRQLGYTTRVPIKHFMELFGILLPTGTIGNSQQLAQALLHDRGISKDIAQVGKTKVFMKASAEKQLHEFVHSRLTHVAIRIQRQTRKWLVGKRRAESEDELALASGSSLAECATPSLEDEDNEESDSEETSGKVSPTIITEDVKPRSTSPSCPVPPAKKRPEAPPKKTKAKEEVPTEVASVASPPASEPEPSASEKAKEKVPTEVASVASPPAAEPEPSASEKAKEEVPTEVASVASPPAAEPEPSASEKAKEKVQTKSPPEPASTASTGSPVKSESQPASQPDQKAAKNAHVFYHNLRQGPLKRPFTCYGCAKQIGPSVKKAVFCTECHFAYHSECLRLGGNCSKTKYCTTNRVIVSSFSDCDCFKSCMVNRLARFRTTKKLSRDDRLLRDTLKEYHSGFILQFSMGVRSGLQTERSINITRRLLENNFKILMDSVMPLHSKANPVLCMRSFVQLLDEYESKRSSHSAPIQPEQTANKGNKEKTASNKTSRDKKEEKVVEQNGHRFLMEFFTVPATCEHCKKSLMALQEGAVCQVCKTTVHKNCIKKIKGECKHKGRETGKWDGNIFGATLTQMYTVTKLNIPNVLDCIFSEIEERGLLTAGLYRKSASPVSLKRLRTELSSAGNNTLDLADFDGHVLGGAIKTFLRELGEPTIPENMYKSFLESAGAEEDQRKRLVLELIPSLPVAHQFFLERLCFHLARVAQNEATNNMNVKNLSIIFAPIVVVPPRGMGAMEALQQVTAQTTVMEVLIEATLQRLASAVTEIAELETEKAVIEQTIEEHIKNDPTLADESGPPSTPPPEPASPPADSPMAPGGEDEDEKKGAVKQPLPAKKVPVPPSKDKAEPPSAPPKVKSAKVPPAAPAKRSNLADGGGLSKSDMVKQLQQQMARLDTHRMDVTAKAQTLDTGGEDYDDGPSAAGTPRAVRGLKAGFAMPMTAAAASPKPAPKKKGKKPPSAPAKAKKPGTTAVASTEPATSLTHVTKARPGGAKGRRPPTRAHRQEMASQADSDL